MISVKFIRLLNYLVLRIQSKILLTIVSVQIVLLVLFSVSIFYFTEDYIDSNFRNELEHRADIYEKVILEKDFISQDSYKDVLEEFSKQLRDENAYYVSYPYSKDSLVDISKRGLPMQFVDDLLGNKLAFFTVDNYEKIFGKEYIVDGNKWLIVISAKDVNGYDILKNLKNLIFYGIITISIIIFIVSYFLARSILKPIKNKIHSAMKISSSNLHERIDIENKNDEIGQLGITFNRMLDRLETSFKLQSSFISNASHEIKNPLTMISGTAEIALLKERSVDEYKKTLESILQDSDNLNTLVNQLFLLAKTDANYEKLPKQYFSLNDVLDFLYSQNNKLYPNKLKIIISNKSQGIQVFGNKDLFISAIQNLVDNAMKFSKGKVVVIETIMENKNLILRVIDNGPGVDSNELNKITSAFYRSESVRDIEGHGIGLALTKKIIDLHNGEIEFENKNISSGLIVTVILPI